MATRVTITKALEAKIRGTKERNEIITEIIERLDDEQGKREVSARLSEAQPGLGYKALVSLFRSYLGDSLLTPPKPSMPYIVKVVNKAKEQGIDSTNVEQIIKGYRAVFRSGPVKLIELVYNADQHYATGAERGGEEQATAAGGRDLRAAGGTTEAEKESADEGRIYHGRGAVGSW